MNKVVCVEFDCVFEEDSYACLIVIYGFIHYRLGGFMFEFKAEQKVFEIAGVKIGGVPGLNPTVLAGTIFYHGHKIVKDEKKGVFDKTEAERLIRLQEEFSEKTGNPCMVDVMAANPEAMRKYLEFVVEVTDKPIVIDGVTADIRIAGIEYASEIGFIDRVVYNSIVPEYRPEELEKIKETGLKAAVLLAFNTKDFTTRGRINALNELIKLAGEIGVEKPLLDTCIIDVPSLGMACRALLEIKSETGLPTGCSPHNAVSTWRGLKQKMGRQAVKPCAASANVAAAMLGADFILYGPIKDCDVVFPSVAMIDAAQAYLLFEKGIKVGKDHPLFKIA